MACLRSSRAVSAAIALVLALGCAGPMAPGPVAGVYALTDVDGELLPALIIDNESLRLRVLGDTILLRPDGTGVVTGVREAEWLGANAAPAGLTRVRVENDFEYRIIGGRLEVAFICPPNANCVKPPHLVARATSAGLRVTYALGMRVPLHYARLAGSPWFAPGFGLGG